jgi:hypothetical protein
MPLLLCRCVPLLLCRRAWLPLLLVLVLPMW